jgi:hypothetical protein
MKIFFSACHCFKTHAATMLGRKDFLKNANNCTNNKFSFYLETSGAKK